MAWTMSTDGVLTALRTAIGASVTVGTTTLTWTKLIEGDPQRWLEAPADYPLVLLKPQDTDGDRATSLYQMDLIVDVYPIIAATNASGTGIAPAAYKTARLVGEAVVGKIMDAGTALGTNWLQRRYRSAGVDYDLCGLSYEHGLLVYKATFAFKWFEAEV